MGEDEGNAHVEWAIGDVSPMMLMGCFREKRNKQNKIGGKVIAFTRTADAGGRQKGAVIVTAPARVVAVEMAAKQT